MENNNNNQEKTQKTNVDDLETGMIAPQFDPTPHIGSENVIYDVSVEQGQYGPYLKVTGSTVAKLGDQEVCPSAVFGLYVDERTGKTGVAEGSKLEKFLKVMGVSHPKDLVGKTAILQTKTSKDGEREFLTFRGA